jgi:hypothetical protein
MDSVLEELYQIRNRLIERRGEERSERSRRLAIVITELEKVIAFYQVFVDNEV